MPYDWGEYVLWHLGPGVKVSMDGRRETVYSDLEYRRSRNFERGTGVWDALLKTTPPTELVLAHNASPTTNLMSHLRGWLPLYQDTYCAALRPRGIPWVDPDHGNPGPGSAR